MQGRIVWLTLLMVLLINGCGGGGGSSSSFSESSTNPAFLSTDKITIEIDKVATFRFKIVARDASNVKYYITGGDANRFSIDVITGELTFLKLDGIKVKSVYKFVAIAEDSVGHREMQDITVSIAEKESVKEESDTSIPTPTPKLTPIVVPVVITLAPTPIPTSTPTPEPITKAPSTTNMVVKKTGQTTSYEPHDDGYYKKGVANNYSRSGEIVTDHVTGLMWQDSEEAKTVQKNWEDAKSYCSNLSLGGYSDWRLPSIRELKGIRDLGRENPTINSHFKNVTSYDYWSSTTNVSDSSNAWYVFFYYGYNYWYSKTNEFRVRCVRGGEFSLTLVLRKNNGRAI